MDTQPNALQQAFTNLGSFFSQGGQGVEGIIGNAVQNFGNSLTNEYQSLRNAYTPTNLLQNAGDAAFQTAQNAGRLGNYFNPNEAANGQNFWNTQFAQNLGQTQGAMQNAPEVDITTPTQKATRNIPLANFIAPLAAGTAQGFINTPSEVFRSGAQIGQDVRTGDIKNPTVAISDLSRAALPIATIATLGSAPGILQGAGSTLGRLAGGALTGGAYGAGFGALSGLQQGRDAGSVAEQALGAVPTALQGAAAGGVVGGGLAGMGVIWDALKGGPAVRDAQGNIVTKDGAKFTPDAQQELVNHQAEIEQARQVYNSPDALRNVMDNYDSFDDLVKTQPLNHSVDKGLLKTAHGDIEMIPVDQIPHTQAENGLEIPKEAIQQLYDQNGLMQLPVYHRTYDEQGTPTLSITDGHHRGPIVQTVGYEQIPAIVIDNAKPLLSDSFNQLKNVFNAAPEDVVATVGKQQQAVADQPAVDKVAQDAAAQVEGDYKTRVKTVPSALEQMGRKGKDVDAVNDMAGARIAVDTPEQAQAAVQAIKNNPLVSKVVKEELVKNPDTGYVANHIDAQVSNSPDTQEFQVMTDNNAIRAESTHNQYKGVESNDIENQNTTQQALSQYHKADGTPSDLPVQAANKGTLTQLARDNAKSNVDLNQLQLNDERLSGKSFLANFEEASQKHDYPLMQSIVTDALQAPPGSKQAQYAQTLQKVLNQQEPQFNSQAGGIDFNADVSLPQPIKDFLQNAKEKIGGFLGGQAQGAAQDEVSGLLKNRGVPLTKGGAQLDADAASLKALNDRVGLTQPQGGKVSTKMTPAQVKAANDFEAEMESQRGIPVKASTSLGKQGEEVQNLPLRAALNKGQTTIDGPLSNQPPGGMTGAFKDIYNRLTQENPTNIGLGRQLTKTVQGRQQVGEILAKNMQTEIQNALPDEASRIKVQHTLDGYYSPKDLNAQETHVFQQLRAINDVISDVRSKTDPFYNPETDYAPRYADTSSYKPENGGAAPLAKPLPQITRENLPREIMKFTPVEGDAKPLIGTIDGLGLRPSQEDPTVLENANGQQFTAGKAFQKEIQDAGVMNYHEDVADTMAENVKNALRTKENFGMIQALKGDFYKGDVVPPGQSAPKGFRQISGARGLEGYYFSPKVADSVESVVKNDPQMPALMQGILKAENTAVQSIFYNATSHPLNMLVNALTASGRGTGPLGMVRFLGHLRDAADMIKDPSNPDYVAYKDAGSDLGTFSKRGPMSFLANSKDPSIGDAVMSNNPVSLLYKANTRAVGYADDLFRVATYKTLQDHGIPLDEAVSYGDKMMVDYGNLSRFERTYMTPFSMFYPYTKGLVTGLGEMATHPIKNAGAIANLAILGAGAMAWQNAVQNFTGNKQASVRMPGYLSLPKQVTGDVQDALQSGGRISQGGLPLTLESHLGKPIAKEAAQQLLNRDFYTGQPIYDPTRLGPNGEPTTSESSARLQHAVGNIIAPFAPGERIALGKKTLPEVGLNMAGISLPHATGYQAAPNLSTKLPSNILGVNLPDWATSLNATSNTLPMDQYSGQPQQVKQGTGIQALQDRAATMARLNPIEQQLYKTSQILGNQITSGKSGTNDKISQAYNDTMARASILAGNPQVADTMATAAQKEATDNGSPLRPLYALDSGQRQIIFNYEKLPIGPERTAFYKQNQGFLSSFYNAEDQYFKGQQAESQQLQQATSIQSPRPSARVQQLLQQAGAKGGDKSLYNDPEVQAYFNADATYKNVVRAELGLGPTPTTSGGGYSSGYSSNSPAALEGYLDRAMLRRELMMADTRVPLQFSKQQYNLDKGFNPIPMTPIKPLELPQPLSIRLKASLPKSGGIQLRYSPTQRLNQLGGISTI